MQSSTPTPGVRLHGGIRPDWISTLILRTRRWIHSPRPLAAVDHITWSTRFRTPFCLHTPARQKVSNGWRELATPSPHRWVVWRSTCKRANCQGGTVTAREIVPVVFSLLSPVSAVFTPARQSATLRRYHTCQCVRGCACVSVRVCVCECECVSRDSCPCYR